MSKRMLMFCVAVLALAIAMPAAAAVQNVKVGGDLTVKALDRYNFALGSTDPNCGGHQDVILSIARLRVDAELTDNVSAVIRLLNERRWDTEDAANTDVTLDLAYATLKEFLYSPLTATIGRQELHFGNDLVIGDVDTNGVASAASDLMAGTGGGTLTDIADLSARKAFDAIRATLNYTVSDQPLAVDLVFAKIDENTTNVDDDVNLYGVNANYVVNDDILAEVYSWTRERRPTVAGTVSDTITAGQEFRKLEPERITTWGTRGVYTGVENLTLQGEYALQLGNKYMDTSALPNLVTVNGNAANPFGYRVEDELVRHEAWALQLAASYALKDVRHNPVLGASYTHLSGENPSTCSGGQGTKWNAWDAMYENQSGGTIFNKLMGYSNTDLFNVNASIKPDFVDDLTVLANWYHILLDKPLHSGDTAQIILSGVAAGQSYVVGNDKHLGDEIDVDLIYDYTEDVQLGLNLGWFLPGDTFNSVNKDAATQAIASMKVAF